MKKIIVSIYIITLLFTSFFSTLLFSTPIAQAASCAVSSAQFNPSGEQANNWYKDNSTQADIIINSSNCVGQTIYLSVWEADWGISNDDVLSDSNLARREIAVTSDTMKLTLKLGEEECEIGPGFDCDLYMELGSGSETANLYSSKGKTGGNLFYECDGVCENNAQLLIPTTTNTQAPVSVSPTASNSPSSQGVYNLLAPIGSLTSIDTTPGGTCPGKPGVSSGIGCYLNWIFTLGIGLCIGLAVIMIIIASIQYMGTESIFGKTEARSKGVAAVMGLFIALGSWAILNTVNPDLLGANGVQIDQVTANIDPETEVAPPSAGTAYTGSGSSKLCSTGYTDVATYGSPSKINVCNSLSNIPIAANLKKMIDAAKANNIILSGWGSRSYATQVKLRIDHGCPDLNAPSTSCSPQTARPGHSNHEIGGAVDFTCNGSDISSHSNACYIWLSQHASQYQFYNLPSEAWHWSYNKK